jgi:hypothetical protein
MQENVSEANSLSASKEISHVLRYLNDHYDVQNNQLQKVKHKCLYITVKTTRLNKGPKQATCFGPLFRPSSVLCMRGFSLYTCDLYEIPYCGRLSPYRNKQPATYSDPEPGQPSPRTHLISLR